MTQAETDKVGGPTPASLIKHANNPYTCQTISIYRLTTGKSQLNATSQDH